MKKSQKFKVLFWSRESKKPIFTIFRNFFMKKWAGNLGISSETTWESRVRRRPARPAGPGLSAAGPAIQLSGHLGPSTHHLGPSCSILRRLGAILGSLDAVLNASRNHKTFKRSFMPSVVSLEIPRSSHSRFQGFRPRFPDFQIFS